MRRDLKVLGFVLVALLFMMVGTVLGIIELVNRLAP